MLHKVALALQVSVEELISPPRAAGRLYAARHAADASTRGPVTIAQLLPDDIPGMEIDRMELPPASAMAGVPHTDGTREYLTCETGELGLTVAGEKVDAAPRRRRRLPRRSEAWLFERRFENGGGLLW